jgi:hypothetical protein
MKRSVNCVLLIKSMKMKKLLLLIGIALSLTINAQVPAIEWQKVLGGTGSEGYGIIILQTTDGGYIIAGNTNSNDGDVLGNHGGYDAWVVKLSTTGIIQWQKAIGGTSYDSISSIVQTTDGGFVLAGRTSSVDGDLIGFASDQFFNHRAWVLKLSVTGNIQWQETLVGNPEQSTFVTHIQQTSDGGFIFTGKKVFWNPQGSFLFSVCWVVKLTPTSGIQWEKIFGGVGTGESYEPGNIQQTTDGGYIFAGYRSYIITTNDAWIVKLSNTGDTQWQKIIGGSGDDGANSIQQTSDGGYIYAGNTNSNDGDVMGNYGSYDGWLVKLSDIGNIQWQKTIGGTGYDVANSFQQTADGGYIVTGITYSNDNDVTGNHGLSDFWVVKLSTAGIIQWQKCLGGSNEDEAYSIQKTSDSGYVVAGVSLSNDNDVTGNHGDGDFWVVKLSPDQLSTVEFSNTSLILYPNPTHSLLNIQTSNSVVLDKIIITDLTGKTVIEQTQNTNQVSVEKLATGVYILNGYSEGNKFQEKFIKQ